MQQEEAQLIQSKLESQLEACHREILELEGMRAQMVARDEIEEKLVRDNEELVSKLSAAEHQLAIQKAGWRSKVKGKEPGRMKVKRRVKKRI